MERFSITHVCIQPRQGHGHGEAGTIQGQLSGRYPQHEHELRGMCISSYHKHVAFTFPVALAQFPRPSH